MGQAGSFPLIAVLGPTGSGKTGLALDLARQLGGEIVNCDSVQLYRGFDIGAAKLPFPLRQDVPHHLIDVLEPSEICSAGDFAEKARPILREIVARGRVPVLAGGTGFYVRALLDGLAPLPTRDDELRARLSGRERARAGLLHRYLRRLDPIAARRIHARDQSKTIRALEISILAKQPVSQWFSEKQPRRLEGFSALKLGLNPNRDALHAVLLQRTRQMYASGLVEEVRGLLDSGVKPSAKPFESLGYKEVAQYIEGKLTLEEAIEWTFIHTRQYAKRQWTWFRRETDITWLSGFGHDIPVLRQAYEIAAAHVDKFG